MRMVAAVALLVGSGLTASAQMTYPLRELENSLREGRANEQRMRREAIDQKRIERKQEQEREAATQQQAAAAKKAGEAAAANKALEDAAANEAASQSAIMAPPPDATAGTEPTRVSVRPGKEVLLRVFSDLTPDCTRRAAPELRLTVGPQHGSTSVRPVTSRVPKSAKCGTRTTPGS